MEPDARREEILVAAERILRRSAANDVRVEDIVREAGAAKGTFYLYFPSFDALLVALRERVFVEFDARYPLPAAVKDWSRLSDFLAAGFVDFTLGLGGLHHALFHGTAMQALESFGAVSRIAAFIEAGMKAGAFTKLDAQPVARLTFAMLHEAVDAIEAGEDRPRVLRSLHKVFHRILLAR